MSSVGSYEAFNDPYLYPGTEVLRNRHGIMDAEALQAFEIEMSTLRSREPLPTGRFGPAHYRNVHRHLFQDVYVWAGRDRTVRITKGGNTFCYPEYIDASMRALFKAKRSLFADALGYDAFINLAAVFLGELNAIHPFREGNGRSQLSFLHLIGVRAGHPFRLDRVREETMLPAMIASFAGQDDLLARELAALGR